MKKVFIIAVLSLIGGVMNAQKVVSDPNVQLREAKNFHAIRVSDAFDVYLTQADEEKVAVSASEASHLEFITVEVKNGVLEIGWKQKGRWYNHRKLKAYVSFKMIDQLKAGGACNVSIVGGMRADDLLVDLSGASDLKGKIDAKKLTFDISGASDSRISGSAVNFVIDASGASKLRGFDFSADYCNITASGASDVKVTVNKELSATASGASDIDYKGSGVIRDIRTSGASSISRS